MKDVKYMGQTFSVPNEAKWIAADSDGEVYTYIDPPSAINGKTWTAYGSGFVGLLNNTHFPCEAC